MANFRCKNTGFVFQAFHLEPKYTVFDNISVPLLISNTPKKEIKEKVNSVLEQVGLTDKIKVKRQSFLAERNSVLPLHELL